MILKVILVKILLSTNLGINGDVIARLIEYLFKNKNFKEYFDNWFTSHTLLICLGCWLLELSKQTDYPIKNFTMIQIIKAGRGSSADYSDTSNNIFPLKSVCSCCIIICWSHPWWVSEKMECMRKNIFLFLNLQLSSNTINTCEVLTYMICLYITDIREKGITCR